MRFYSFSLCKKRKYAAYLELCDMSKSTNTVEHATENHILKFLTVSSVSSDSIVKGIIDDIVNTVVKTAEVHEQKTKYLQHSSNQISFDIDA
jgi:hypothetical protein